MFHNYTVNSLTMRSELILHMHTRAALRSGRRKHRLTWLYTLTHIAAALEGEEGQQEEMGEEKGGGGDSRAARPARQTHIHLCHTATVLRANHASSCQEGRLTFHCLHNLD